MLWEEIFFFLVRTLAVIPMRETFGFNDQRPLLCFCVFVLVRDYHLLKKKKLTWRFYIRMIDYTHKYQKSSRHEAIRFKPKNHIVFSHLVLQSYQLHDYDYPRVLLASNCLMEHENICLAWALNLRKIAKNFDYYARDDAAMKIFKKKKSSI